MRVTNDLSALDEPLPYPVVALGVFDGVHLGHQSILQILLERAADFDGTPVMLSFSPHPQKIIAPQTAPALLQTRTQKQELLRKLGIEVLVELPFTRRLSLLSPHEFVLQNLVRHRIREIHVGSNFRFGHRRSGDFALLRKIGEEHDFRVFETPVLVVRRLGVSSTRIRAFLLGGQVSMASRLLGRPYEVQGTIVRGAQRGRKLGFPTANLRPQNELIPAPGVYVTRTRVNGDLFDSVTNIGYRPTVEANSSLSVETHLLDVEADLYGKSMSIEFCCRIRDEHRFSGIQELQERINKDVSRAQSFFARQVRESR